MKISFVSAAVVPAYKFNSNQSSYNNYNNRVSFGFGDDYGDDKNYLAAEDYVHKSNGSLIGYVKYLGQFCYAVVKENIFDNIVCSGSTSSSTVQDEMQEDIDEDYKNMTSTYDFYDEDII